MCVCVCVCIVEVPVVVKGEDADFDGEIEQRDSCTLPQSFDAINNAFITLRVTNSYCGQAGNDSYRLLFALNTAARRVNAAKFDMFCYSSILNLKPFFF